MTRSSDLTETELLGLLRDRFLSEGYQFIAQPSHALLPGFLGDYRPDAIALKGPGGVVLEITRTGKASNKDDLAALSRRLQEHPEWRLELVFADNFVRPEPFGSGFQVQQIADEDYDRLRSEVRSLADSGHFEAALVMGWALLEAAARRRLSEGKSGRGPLTGWQIVEQLAHHGLIEPGQVNMLRPVLERRNLVAHGLSPTSAGAEDVSALLSIVDGLTVGAQV